MSKFFMMFQVFSILTSWFSRAMMDGKITAQEMTGLVTELAGIFGLQTEIELPDADFPIQPIAAIEAETDAIADGSSPVPTGGLHGIGRYG